MMSKAALFRVVVIGMLLKLFGYRKEVRDACGELLIREELGDIKNV